MPIDPSVINDRGNGWSGISVQTLSRVKNTILAKLQQLIPMKT